MSDGVALLSMIAGFGFVIIVGARLGAGSFRGMFATQGARDWPTGVQEGDAPHFVLAGLRPHAVKPSGAATRAAEEPFPPAIEELYAGPIRPRH